MTLRHLSLLKLHGYMNKEIDFRSDINLRRHQRLRENERFERCQLVAATVDTGPMHDAVR